MVHPEAETGSHDWGLGCAICRWAGLKSKMARCKKTDLAKLSRHQMSSEHGKALEKWRESQGGVSTEAPENPLAEGGNTLVNTGTSRKPPDVIRESPVLSRENVGYGHVLKMLELFQEQNSLRSFARSVEAGRALHSDIHPGNGSRTVAAKLLHVCAGYETWVNRPRVGGGTAGSLVYSPALKATSKNPLGKPS